MTDHSPRPLKHSAQITVSLRSNMPHESAGVIQMSVEDASAVDVLKWLEIPLAMLRDQAEADKHHVR